MSQKREELDDHYQQEKKNYQAIFEQIREQQVNLQSGMQSIADYANYLSHQLTGIDYSEVTQAIAQESQRANDQLHIKQQQMEQNLAEVTDDYRRRSHRLDEEEIEASHH